jgi:hypothetical protein
MNIDKMGHMWFTGDFLERDKDILTLMFQERHFINAVFGEEINVDINGNEIETRTGVKWKDSISIKIYSQSYTARIRESGNVVIKWA